MHSSYFSYNISRPYPFRWFTPVALSCGVVLTVLFSLVNLAGNGYRLRSIYTNDPNTTLSTQKVWFMEAPFNWGKDLDPQCEPQPLSIGNRLFTTNLGMSSYEVTTITRYQDDASAPVSLPAVLYLNNTLENCITESVVLELRKSDFSRPKNSWWISWSPSSYATAAARCTVMSDASPSNITLQVRYSGAGDNTNFAYMISDNYTTHASAWWGTRLLNAYWNGVLTTMASANLTEALGDNVSYWNSASVGYKWNNSETKNIRDLDFFDLEYSFTTSNGAIVHQEWDGREVIDLTQDPTVVYNSNNPNFSFSPTLTEGLYFAKIMHSLLAVDLGNSNAPNLLLREDDVRYALDPPDDINRNSSKGVLYAAQPASFQNFALLSWPGVPPPGKPSRVRLSQSYDLFHPLMGSLGTNNATLFTQYLCSILEQKSTGTMLLAMVIADLVFLQAAWKILKGVAEIMLQKQDPAAMACEGCLGGASGAIPTTVHSLGNVRIGKGNTRRDSDSDTKCLIDR